MYETVEYNKLHAVCLPADAERKFQELAGAVTARSQIVWGEHCTECAFPACYSNCEFYTPRADLHCRRFAEGIVQVSIGEVRAAKIRFRKWAKLEGKGPVHLISANRAVRREAADRLISRLIVRLAPSQTMYARAARLWNIWKDWRTAGYSAQTSVFVVEAWLGASPSIGFTLTFLPTDDSTSNLYQRRFEICEGYNRILIACEEIAAHVDLRGRFLVQIEPVGDSAGREVIFGLVDFLRFEDGFGATQIVPSLTPRASREPKELVKKKRTAKCVVWDLDNTIWHGTLAEDGPEALVPDPVAVSTIVELDSRGILQSIASKNDPEITLATLEKFKLREYFLFPQIGWDPKSDSLKRIAENLDIDLNTFVFIDDQPFERGEVVETLPMVTVLPDAEIPRLLTSPLFDVPATAESAKRRSMYQVEELRQSTFTGSGTDYLTFLYGCRIQLVIESVSGGSLERAYELSQRTNQLNFSGLRYSRDDLARLMGPESKSVGLILRCSDKFGDYGIIGMCVLDRDRPQIDSFMMSCRVQRKRVEHSFFSWLAEQLRSRGEEIMRVRYRKTERNHASVRMLEELGFEYHSRDNEEGMFVRRLDLPFEEADVVQIVDRTRVGGQRGEQRCEIGLQRTLTPG